MGTLSAAPEPASRHTTDTSMTDFRAATAAHWRAAFLRGDVSAVELVTTALTASAAHASLGAFLHLEAEAPQARAAELDAVRDMLLARRGASRERGLSELSARSPLLGLPTAFKDLLDVAGMPTTLGTAALPPRMPAKDDPAVRRVHAAGAISIGKTQVPEFGLPCYSENPVSEPSRNPLDPARTSGGSSGGAAAAVAAGLLPLAPGTDGGGSVRIPAAACGLIGLKPGRGRLPDEAPGPAAPAPAVRRLAVAGPIADTVEDAALLFDVMAGGRFGIPPARRPARPGRRAAGDDDGVLLAEGPAMRTVREALAGTQRPLQIGVTTESPFSPDLDVVLAEDAVLAVEEGIAALERAGHLVQGSDHCTGSDRFWPEGYHQDFQTLWTSQLGRLEFTAEQEELLTPLTRYFLELGRGRQESEAQAAVEALQGFAEGAEEIFGPWDVLLTPMLAFAPPEVGWFASLAPEENYIQQCRFTPYSSVVNVLGLPAINVPVHIDGEGLSWSVQLIGKHGCEEQLLALAAVMLREL